MVDTVINYLDKFGPELLVIQFGFLVILSTMFLWLWLLNRKKYHNYKHAIPANVVKNYLDSIIQNSNALKSSLFRGGGMDVGHVPSVIPLNNLLGGDSLGLSGAPSTALMEEVNHKKALVSTMESQLLALQTSQREMEARMSASASQAQLAEAKIKELEALLAKARSSGGGDANLKEELTMISKERDEMRERLKEFEIISDDLANLKKLQQENERLKRSLAAQQGSREEVSEVAKEETSFSPTEPETSTQDLDQLLTESQSEPSSGIDPLVSALEAPAEVPLETQAEPEALTASAETPVEKDPAEEKKAEKTPEDLLSEFEKMLG